MTPAPALARLVGWAPRDRKRTLQLALGAVWLVDAGLQFQPYMFSPSFVSQALAPAATGVPGLLGRSISGMATFLLPHIAEWNALFALTQLAIGVGLVLKPTVRVRLRARSPGRSSSGGSGRDSAGCSSAPAR